MIIRDALPRTVDLRSSLGVDADEVSVESAVELLARHPDLCDLSVPLDEERIAEDAARHLESLGLAVEQGAAHVFVDYVGWVSRVLVARGLPKACLADHLAILKRLVGRRLEAGRVVQVEAIFDEALATLETPGLSDVTFIREERMRATGSALLQALLGGDREEAIAAVEAGFQQGLKLLDTYLGVIQPVMYEVGRLWQENEITVAQEHVATALMQSVMAYCYRRFYTGRVVLKGTVALTGVAGEPHELGLRVLRDVVEAHHWKVLYLGTNCPPDEVVRTLEAHPPDAIGVSVTMTFNLKAAEELIRRLRASEALKRCPIFVGGPCASVMDDTWRALNVHCCERDAQAFLDCLDELVGSAKKP